ncbi:Crp/Fnr family transcriptional regulator [Desulfobacter postgatei]|uniref:Cyclic nucleotide-binding protein n=1 Tax=Desulfobacter postgatei 2ac9 TaxID=879212 RepID=I5B318_9BACT|nr:Crp/Fnr family transcriptional regulator [Desulfobacter postgatei]EIM63881.1 cyclic nucleotide-binding protein [Desulfobacter postgatei 2ac9]
MLDSIFLTVNQWMTGGLALAAPGCFIWGVISVLFSPCHLASIPLIVGYVLWNEGKTAGRMISIISGKVKIFRPLADGKSAAIYIFGPGDTFSFMPLIHGSSYPASAEAVDDVKALVMTREKLHTVMKQKPEIAIFLLEHLCTRLREAFNQIERLSTKGILGKGNIEKAGWAKLAMTLIDLPDLQGVKK